MATKWVNWAAKLQNMRQMGWQKGKVWDKRAKRVTKWLKCDKGWKMGWKKGKTSNKVGKMGSQKVKHATKWGKWTAKGQNML